MERMKRLLCYVRPYRLQLVVSVVMMALVGALDAFRILLIRPILDRVLNPASQSRDLALFPGSNGLRLQQLVPPYFHIQNPWTVVAFALVAATVLKGIFSYARTHMVNFAGFGASTHLPNELYSS